MYSKYLNAEVSAEIIERKISDQVVKDYDINSLRDIVYNAKNNKSFKGIYPIVETVPVAFSTPDHPAFICTICDANDRRVQAIGECDINSLFDDESVCNIVGIAFERAFKNAVVKYLGIEEFLIPFSFKPKKFFLYEPESDIPEEPDPEVPNEPVESPVPEIYTEDISEQVTVVQDAIVVEDPDDELVFNSSSVISSEEIPEEKPEEKIEENNVIVEEETTPVVEETSAPVEEAPVTEEVSENKTEEEDFASVIITIGKYNGKNKTAKELVESDSNWVDWVLNNMKSTNPDIIKQKEALAKCKS